MVSVKREFQENVIPLATEGRPDLAFGLSAVSDISIWHIIGIAIVAAVFVLVICYMERTAARIKRAEGRLKEDKLMLEKIWMVETDQFRLGQVIWMLESLCEDELGDRYQKTPYTGNARYTSKSFKGVQDTPLVEFLLPDERISLRILMREHGLSEELLNRRVERWNLFPLFMSYRTQLHHLHEHRKRHSISDNAHASDHSHEWSMLSERMEPLLEIVEQIGEVRELPPYLQAHEDPKARVQDEKEPPKERTMSGYPSFEELARGASDVSHLREAYEKVTTLLEGSSHLTADIIRWAEQTLEEIKGLVDAQREREVVEKATLDYARLLDVRESIGLEGWMTVEEFKKEQYARLAQKTDDKSQPFESKKSSYALPSLKMHGDERTT